MADLNGSEFNDINTTIVANLSDVPYTDSSTFKLYEIIWYLTLVLGIPGNVLSAIVWLRRRVSGNNSSAVYLAALAIDDLVYLLLGVVYDFTCGDSWLCHCCKYLLLSAFNLNLCSFSASP